jgi:hypothetical protein
MVSKKESQFVVQNVISDADFIRIFRTGLNSAVSFSDFKTSLGVTGSISQVGDPLGAPVLYTSGDNYFIRNIESTKGVQANVSAQNGVSLGLNIAQASTGVKLIDDLNAKQYQLKTIKEGANVSLTDEGDAIEINFVTSAVTTKTVVVSEESDFPTPAAGVITLEPDTDYLLANDISTANRFVVSRPNTIRASSSQMVSLTYTGSGDMFTGANPSFKIVNITVDAPNGNIFNTTAPSLPGIVQMVESNVKSCQTLGAIDGNFITRFSNVAFENIVAGGLTFAGTNNILVVDVGVAFLGGGSLIDLGTSTFESISIDGGVIASSAPGTFFLSGLTNSGNIVPGGLGSVINNKGFGSGSSLNGITTDDARWNFLANNVIADTRPDALLYLSAPATTTITTSGVPVLVNGAWTEQRTSQMSSTAAGRVTYDGEKPSTLPITAKVSAEPVSGSNVTIGIYLVKNGVVVSASEAYGTADSGRPTSITAIWQDSWNNGDYYEIYIENDTNTTNLIVSNAQLRVN